MDTDQINRVLSRFLWPDTEEPMHVEYLSFRLGLALSRPGEDGFNPHPNNR